jgi:Flp pilus assembly protein TadD
MKYRVLLQVGFAVLCSWFQVGMVPAAAQTAFSPTACAQEQGVLPSQDCVNSILIEGRVLVGNGDFAGALVLYQKVAQVAQGNPRVYSAIGFLQVRQNDFQAAVMAYQKAITLDPRNSRFYYALGFSLAHLGDNDGAEKAYRRTIDLAPNDANAYLSLGIILTRKGQYQRALLAHVTALTLQPNNPQIYRAIGAVYMELGKYQEANTFFERAGQLSYRPMSLNKSENGLIGYRQ